MCIRYYLSGYLWIFIFLLLTMSGFAADIYRYTDRSGQTHITDSIQNVPEEYRGKVQKVKPEDLEKNASRIEKTSKVDPKASGEDEAAKIRKNARESVWFIFFMLALYIGVGVLGRVLKARKLASIVKIIIVIALVYHLFSSYYGNFFGLMKSVAP